MSKKNKDENKDNKNFWQRFAAIYSLFMKNAFIKPTNEEFKGFIEKNGFSVVEYDRVGSKLAPICCMIARK